MKAAKTISSLRRPAGKSWISLRGECEPKGGSAGYDRRWRRLRNWYIRRHPLCEICLQYGLTVPAVEVHHKVPLKSDRNRRLDVDNLQSLCKACHARLTAREKRQKGGGG